MSAKLLTSLLDKPNTTSVRCKDLYIDGNIYFEESPIPSPFVFTTKIVNQLVYVIDNGPWTRQGSGNFVDVIYRNVGGVISVTFPQLTATIPLGTGRFLGIDIDPDYLPSSNYYRFSAIVEEDGVEEIGVCDIDLLESPVGRAFVFKKSGGAQFTGGSEATTLGAVTLTYTQ